MYCGLFDTFISLSFFITFFKCRNKNKPQTCGPQFVDPCPVPNEILSSLVVFLLHTTVLSYQICPFAIMHLLAQHLSHSLDYKLPEKGTVSVLSQWSFQLRFQHPVQRMTHHKHSINTVQEINKIILSNLYPCRKI